MNEITVTPSDRGPGQFDVAVGGGARPSTFKVTVPAGLPAKLGDPDPETLVRESFVFLLEREPVSSIMGEFSLDVISRYFPEYEREIASRLAR